MKVYHGISGEQRGGAGNRSSDVIGKLKSVLGSGVLYPAGNPEDKFEEISRLAYADAVYRGQRDGEVSVSDYIRKNPTIVSSVTGVLNTDSIAKAMTKMKMDRLKIEFEGSSRGYTNWFTDDVGMAINYGKEVCLELDIPKASLVKYGGSYIVPKPVEISKHLKTVLVNQKYSAHLPDIKKKLEGLGLNVRVEEVRDTEGELEKMLSGVSIFFMICFFLFFLSSNVTGNVIGVNSSYVKYFSLLGFLFFVGMFWFAISFRNRNVNK